jgi:hypothetical protein
MDNKWAEDTYRSFEQEHGKEEAFLDNMAKMQVRLEYWCETNGLIFSEVLQRASGYKKLVDGADRLVNEGFEPPQVSMILQHHFALGVDPIIPCPVMEVDPSLWTDEERAQ